jgi:hypothetical protein
MEVTQRQIEEWERIDREYRGDILDEYTEEEMIMLIESEDVADVPLR